MTYVVRDSDGAELLHAEGRSAVVSYLRCHVNGYTAVRLVDQADGLRPSDGVPRPVTVTRED